MLSDSDISIKWGSLSGPEPDSSILAVVTFVERRLVEFANEYAGSCIKNEKGLTQKLCNILNNKAKNGDYPFWFDKEYMEEPERGNSPQVDLGVLSSLSEGIVIDSKYYNNDESFFLIEAKRLCKISSAREKEYLIGRIENGKYLDCGGIERFKKEIHGKNHKYAAIIGYVQEHDFHYWHKSINSWIDNLINGTISSSINWSEKDKLSKGDTYPTTAKYKSENSRHKGYISLFHLWVNLSKKQ